MTRFGRRDESLPDLIAEAGLAALADAGIERPDALVVAAMNPEEFTGAGNYASLINTHLGLSDVPALRVETATSSGVAFYLISAIWTRPRPGGPDYVHHFLCWTIAFLPGFVFLLARPAGPRG